MKFHRNTNTYAAILTARYTCPSNLYQFYRLQPCPSAARGRDSSSKRIPSYSDDAVQYEKQIREFEATLRLPTVQPPVPTGFSNGLRERAHAWKLGGFVYDHDLSVGTFHRMKIVAHHYQVRYDFHLDHELHVIETADIRHRDHQLDQEAVDRIRDQCVKMHRYHSNSHKTVYDMTLRYRWDPPIKRRHIQDLSLCISKRSVRIYLHKLHVLALATKSRDIIPIPTIGALSSIVYMLMLNLRSRQRYAHDPLHRPHIATLLAMGIRWHPAYAYPHVLMVRPAVEYHTFENPAQPIAYDMRYTHRDHYNHLRRLKCPRFYYDPTTMEPCDVLLVFTMCLHLYTNKHGEYLPIELRLHVLQYVDLLSIMPSINSVQRYIHGMYF